MNIKEIDLIHLLKLARELNASDLHIVVNLPPIVRKDGKIMPLKFSPLTGTQTKSLIYSILTQKQIEMFEKNLELDCGFSLPGSGRYRLNIYFAQEKIEGCFRVIPSKIKSIRELGLPEVVEKFCEDKMGLIVITGPCGSGKTTTLNAMVDFINSTKNCRIISIEDPVEYLHQHKKSIIIQRQVNTDTLSFNNALIHSLREDPDVICVGEMRDLETIATTLTAAETGHLVLATLHTPDTIRTINRIVDVFPYGQQDQIRIQLAGCIRGVVAQQLLPMKDNTGRILATEILVANNAVRNLIRERKTEQIYSILQTGQNTGMQPMDYSLLELHSKGLISYDTAISRVKDINVFK
ncbi:type IV pilus twitching motility protein PilT [Candidatus Omnitrophota bacterium]